MSSASASPNSCIKRRWYAEAFLDSPVGEVAEPHHIWCYCSKLYPVEEDNQSPSVALPFHRVDTSKMIHVVNTCLVSIVVGNYFWLGCLTINRLVWCIDEGMMTALFFLDRYDTMVSRPVNPKTSDCSCLSWLGCISAGMLALFFWIVPM